MEKLESNLKTEKNKANASGNLKHENDFPKTQKNSEEISQRKNSNSNKKNSQNESKKNKQNNSQKKEQNILQKNTSINTSSEVVHKSNVTSESVEKSAIKNTENNKKNNKKNNTENNFTKNNIQENKKNNMQIASLKKEKNNKKIILIILFIILFIFLLFFSTIFALTTSGSNKIISGISVNGVDLSGLTKSDAEKKLNDELSSDLINKIIVSHGDYSKTIETQSLGATYSIEESINQAYNVGRSENNIFQNNFNIIKTYIGKININPSVTYNSDLLIEKINEINNELPDRVINSSYEIKDNTLIVSNSTNGYRIQNEKFKEQIQLALANRTASFEIPVEEYEANKVNIDAIYEQIYKEPKDATFKNNPYEIIKEEDGLDFAISLEEARKIVLQEQESYTIPLKKLTPKVTVKTLPSEAFPDTLATYYTTYASSNYNRSTNISLASKSINGYVLMPGESFSYNTTVGQRTAARGYKEAGVYVNGAVSTDYGGGICQVSSTLYNSVLLANLEVVQRTNHTFEPSYVPAGQDATVSWKSPDFIFKNNRNYPIKIVASAGSGRIQVDIIGLKTSDDYVVKVQSSKTGTIPFTTEYKDDNTLPAGTTKVTQYGSNGCKSQTYKILYKDGKEVSRTLLSSDTYKPHNQVIIRGTKIVSDPTPQPAPQQPTQPAEPQTPEPSEAPSENESSVTITTDIPQ